MDEKRGVGKQNDLLFKIPEDFQRMKALTMGHPIIMGRKTYESIGRPLPKRTNIVVTSKNQKIEGCIVVHSLEEALEKAKESEGNDEIFIFGGGEIWRQAMPLVDRLYITIVKGDYNADTFFPDYSDFKKEIKSETGESNGYSYTFLDLER